MSVNQSVCLGAWEKLGDRCVGEGDRTSPLRWIVRMELVLHPGFRIIANILANVLEGRFVSNDVLVIIALPQSFIKRLPILLFYPSDIGISRHCFEPLHHSRHRHTRIQGCFIDP
jgi:hypothetical protein